MFFAIQRKKKGVINGTTIGMDTDLFRRVPPKDATRHAVFLNGAQEKSIRKKDAEHFRFEARMEGSSGDGGREVALCGQHVHWGPLHRRGEVGQWTWSGDHCRDVCLHPIWMRQRPLTLWGKSFPIWFAVFFAIFFDFNQQPDNYTKFVDTVIHWGRFTGYSAQLCIA